MKASAYDHGCFEMDVLTIHEQQDVAEQQLYRICGSLVS
jgi:hypothetical protein